MEGITSSNAVYGVIVGSVANSLFHVKLNCQRCGKLFAKVKELDYNGINALVEIVCHNCKAFNSFKITYH